MESLPDQQAPPRQVGVREFRSNMTGLLRQARNGASFLITSLGEVIAELHPPSPATRAPRRPGALRGRIALAPDFDALPADLLAAMEGAADEGAA
jgi:antitoxin (DNA-binding transcriptional repressor) of toxin-antitoxin stability system